MDDSNQIVFGIHRKKSSSSGKLWLDNYYWLNYGFCQPIKIPLVPCFLNTFTQGKLIATQYFLNAWLQSKNFHFYRKKLVHVGNHDFIIYHLLNYSFCQRIKIKEVTGNDNTIFPPFGSTLLFWPHYYWDSCLEIWSSSRIFHF